MGTDLICMIAAQIWFQSLSLEQQSRDCEPTISVVSSRDCYQKVVLVMGVPLTTCYRVSTSR